MCGGGKSGPVPLQQRPDDQLMAIAKPVQPTVQSITYRGKTFTPQPYTFRGKTITPQPNPLAVKKYNADLGVYNEAQVELQRRQQVKDQLAAQAADRENILKAQREQVAEMEREQAAIITQQQAQAAQLKVQQEERVAGIRAAGSAVTQSLQILGKQQAKQGPTAAATAPAGKKAVSRMAPNSGLRIGSTQAGSGAGANVAI